MVQSLFLAYVLYRLRNDQHDSSWTSIVLTNQKARLVWLFQRGNDVVLRFDEEGFAYHRHLDSSTNIYLFDAGAPGMEPETCCARTLVVSSPNVDHYKEWRKGHPSTLYMPPWSWEEVEAACLDVMPRIDDEDLLTDPATVTDDQRKALAKRRFKRYGGIARDIFSSAAAYTLQRGIQDVFSEAGSALADATARLGCRRSPFTAVSHRIFHIVPDSTFEDYHGMWASESIENEALQRLAVRGAAAEAHFLTVTTSSPMLSALAGRLWERYCHRRIANGGTFVCRRLGCIEDYKITLPQREIKPFDQSSLATVTSYYHCNQRSTYGKPASRAYAAMDGFGFPDELYQYTVGAARDVNVAEFNRVLQDMEMTARHRHFPFYFVVPSTQYSTFDISHFVPSSTNPATEPCWQYATFWVVAMPIMGFEIELANPNKVTSHLQSALRMMYLRTTHHCLSSLCCVSPLIVAFVSQLPDRPPLDNLPRI